MTLTADQVTKSYHGRHGTTVALHPTTLTLRPGDSTGVVGPSGSGKSTLLSLLIGLAHPDVGTIRLDGEPARFDRAFRAAVQYVPQDPATSLDPRLTVRRQVREPLRRLGVEGDHEAMVAASLEVVGLHARHLDARAGTLSGGQAQRAAIARAVVTRPRFILADEPTSGLDAPLRLHILHLLRALCEAGAGVILVTHDLAGAARLCRDLHVLDHGHVVETGPCAELLARPRHPLTRELVDAIPRFPH